MTKLPRQSMWTALRRDRALAPVLLTINSPNHGTSTSKTAVYGSQVAQFLIRLLKLHWQRLVQQTAAPTFCSTGVKSSPILRFSRSVGNTDCTSWWWVFRTLTVTTNLAWLVERDRPCLVEIVLKLTKLMQGFYWSAVSSNSAFWWLDWVDGF